MEFLISGILCGLVILLSFIIYKRKIKRNSNVIRDEIYRKEKEKIVVQVQKELNVLYNQKSQVENEIQEKFSFNDSLLKMREEELNRLIEEKKKEKIQILDEQIEKYFNEQYKVYNDLFEVTKMYYEEAKEIGQQEVEKIVDKLAEYRSFHETINKAILREKEIQEKEEFYKIVIIEDDKDDIEVLKEIKNKLKNKEVIQKLIWEIFIKRPASEMIKRITAGNKISGIYKVTYLKTGEAYIGRSVDISNRWIEHIKTSLSIGSIAHSSFHNRLEKDGIWNYSWEILEELPKEKNAEREKYWINFYETNKYGLNQRDGG